MTDLENLKLKLLKVGSPISLTVGSVMTMSGTSSKAHLSMKSGYVGRQIDENFILGKKDCGA